MDTGAEELTTEGMPETRRRVLVRFIAAAGAAISALAVLPGVGMLLAPVLASSGKQKRRLLLSGASQVAATTFVLARYEGQEDSEPGIYYRMQDGKPVAISAKCTHAGCPVQWRTESDQFICPCHQGHFDATGRNISGPPPRPLDHLQAQVENGVVYVEVAQA